MVDAERFFHAEAFYGGFDVANSREFEHTCLFVHDGIGDHIPRAMGRVKVVWADTGFYNIMVIDAVVCDVNDVFLVDRVLDDRIVFVVVIDVGDALWSD